MATSMTHLEIQEWSISGAAFALDDEVTLSVKLKNISGSKIYGLAASIYADYSYFDIPIEAVYPDWRVWSWFYNSDESGTLSWANGSSKTFTMTFKLGDDAVFRQRFLAWQAEALTRHQALTRFITATMCFRTTYRTSISGGGYVVATLDDTYDFGQIWDYHYGLEVKNFDIERATSGAADDEGTGDLTAIRIGVGPDYAAGGATLKLYYAAGAVSTSSSYIDLTAHIPTLLSVDAIVVASYFPGAGVTLSAAHDYNFMLEFTDGFDRSVAYSSVSRAFANVHLSGASTGGVAFGKFSAATEGNPLFECEYPARFGGEVFAEGGIAGVTNYPAIPSGASGTEVATGGKWIDGKPIYRYVLQYTTSSTSTSVLTIGALPSLPETVINIRGVFKTSASSFPINMYRPASNVQITACWIRMEDGAILHQVSSALALSRTLTIIVEYTKHTT